MNLFVHKQILRDFQKLGGFLDANPAYEFKMNDAQAETYAPKNRSYCTTLFWGNRSGKTTIGVLETMAHCIGYRPWLPPQHPMFIVRSKGGKPVKPPVPIRVLAMDFEEHVKITLIPSFQKWLPSIINKSRGFETRKHTSGAVDHIKFPNGSEVFFVTDKQESYEGASFAFLWQDELVNKGLWSGSLRGLVDHDGTVLMTLTPFVDPNDARRNVKYIIWVINEVYRPSIEQMELEKSDPDYTAQFRSYFASSDVNVGFGITQSALDTFASTLTADEKESRLHGKPMLLTAGLVYSVRAEHRKAMPKSNEHPVWVGVDPHHEKAHYALFAQLWPKDDTTSVRSGHLHVFAYVIERNIKHFVERQIEIEPRLASKDKYGSCKVVADPSYLNHKDWVSDTSFKNYLVEYGIRSPIAEAEKFPGSIEQGVVAIQKRLAEGSITFDPSLSALFCEFDSYIRDFHGKPIKKGADLLDCLRMIILDNPYYFAPTENDTKLVDNANSAYAEIMDAILSPGHATAH
jgi:hypothetical protein